MQYSLSLRGRAYYASYGLTTKLHINVHIPGVVQKTTRDVQVD